jgi:hypothetical protein
VVVLAEAVMDTGERQYGQTLRADDGADPSSSRRVSLRPWRGGQVDFLPGAPTLDAATDEWRRPWAAAAADMSVALIVIANALRVLSARQ